MFPDENGSQNLFGKGCVLSFVFGREHLPETHSTQMPEEMPQHSIYLHSRPVCTLRLLKSSLFNITRTKATI